MEDGSIFVCFLCEKEFRQVSLLNQHMIDHGPLPEMSEKFPSRKKAKSHLDETIKSKISSITKHQNESIGETSFSVQNKKIQQESSTQPKSQSLSSSSNQFSSPQLHNNKQTVLMKMANLKQEIPQRVLTNATVKPDPDAHNEVSLAMKRAMKIKKYIERKENTAKRKLHTTTSEMGNGVTEETEVELDGMQESIMMVDSSFFNSGMSKTPIGPTIMNAEPDGFMVPQKVSLGPQPHSQRKQREDNYYVCEPLYDEESTNGFEDEIASQVQVVTPNYHPIVRRRGRGRGKRGRPAKIKREMAEYEDLTIQSVHRSPKERSVASFQCPECYKEFRTVFTMKVHMKSHAEVREIPCPYCDEVFPQRYILYEHLISDHEESNNLTCPVCNKIFTRPDSLKSHMVRMHEENGGLNCYVCGKNFPSQGQLEMHVRVHTGERPFKCDICRRGFVQKVHLHTHLRTVHNLSEVNSTPCRICEEMFDGRAGLREHYVLVHGLTTAAYKNQVAKLRKEGRIPEILPPKVKVVDPSFRYQKVAVTEVDDTSQQSSVTSQLTSTSTPSSPSQNGELKTNKTSLYLTRKAGRKLKINTRLPKCDLGTPGMGTVMNLVSDEVMFAPVTFDLENDRPKGRDQHELRIVESAFKVAEEMDQMREENTTLLVTDDSDSSAGIYYSIPIEEADDEYAQFAAEHAHIDDGLVDEGILATQSSVKDDEADQQSPSLDEREQNATKLKCKGANVSANARIDVSTSVSRRGAIVKAEPLDLYTDSQETTQPVEMLTM